MHSPIFGKPTVTRRSRSAWKGSRPRLDPFVGRLLVHGGDVDVREGADPGTLVIIEFPSMAEGRSWYESLAYHRIRLRTRQIAGDVILVEGVKPDQEDCVALARTALHGSKRPLKFT